MQHGNWHFYGSPYNLRKHQAESLPDARPNRQPMRFVQLIIKNLQYRPTRTGLTLLALTMSVAAMVSLLSIAWGFADAANTFYAKRNVDVVVVRAGVSDRLTSSLRISYAAKLKQISGVADTDASLTEMISLGEGSLFGIPLRGLDPIGFSIRQLSITHGQGLPADAERQILLGTGIAESLHKSPGDPLVVEGEKFTVAGIFTSENLMETNSVVIPLRECQKLMDRPGQVTEIQVRAEATSQTDTAIRDLCQRIEQMRDDDQQHLGVKAQPARQYADTATETKLSAALAWGTTIIVFGLSFLGMLNTMLMSVLERTREIGILRAVGWTRARVVRMILGESVVLSVVAALLGILIAWLGICGMSHWTLTKTLVSPGVSGMACICGSLFALGAGLAGAFYPAFRGASVPATEALRYE